MPEVCWVCIHRCILTGLSTGGSSRRGYKLYQTCSSNLVLFSVYTLEIVGRGNQPHWGGGGGDPGAPHPLNESLFLSETIIKHWTDLSSFSSFSLLHLPT